MEFEYIRWLPTLGWFAINIAIPVFGPLLLLWIVGMPPATAPLATNGILKAIGKGELLWAVMGMAAATCYELVCLQEVKAVAAWSTSIWTAFGIHIVLIIVAVILVGLNSLDPPPGYVPSRPHIPSMRIFVMSILALIVVIVTYSATHATFSDQEAKNNDRIKAEEIKKTVEAKQAIIDRIAKCLATAKGNGKHCMEGIK